MIMTLGTPGIVKMLSLRKSLGSVGIGERGKEKEHVIAAPCEL
jgi:hypothetical protein